MFIEGRQINKSMAEIILMNENPIKRKRENLGIERIQMNIKKVQIVKRM